VDADIMWMHACRVFDCKGQNVNSMEKTMSFSNAKAGEAKVVARYARLSAMIVVGAVVVGLATGGKASAAVNRSCGTVSESAHVKWRVTITKGSPSCEAVRAIARRYGHPKAVHYNCPQKSHVCQYGVFPEGWRCTGLFQGDTVAGVVGTPEGKMLASRSAAPWRRGVGQ
jgi:hypothetical protein